VRTPYEVTASGCWLWLGRIAENGYGRYSGKLAHRMMYELIVGPIPPDFDLDHLCRVRGCVNPDHLEPVTGDENARRAALAITHCKRGHSYTAENTYHRPTTGHRDCRACIRARALAYKARKRNAA